jgi:hypothetical protein
VPLSCENCGGGVFRLRRASGGAEAECIECGAIIQNSALRAATNGSPPILAPEPANPDEGLS